ncbi:Glycosyl hydrolases family 28 [Caprobacter fermentans]|uniref:Glycosyl hydrolases family 28 n=1 Tax=Caproicibacter fermentans TaxID=2576756 RepID=A0A6N8HYX0_9FIRM|nr:Glycosyl hydrolases family 28 [Caproicibacter fermentans]
MDFKIIGLFVRSVSFELTNSDCYHSRIPYDVELNGRKIAENLNRNIFSLYDLRPNTEYRVTVSANGTAVSHAFTTKRESFRLNARDFGAAGDGVKQDTSAIQAAILCCPKNGTVLIPSGVYLTGPLFLKSDMTLELAEGAMLLGMTDRSVYPVLPGVTQSEDEREEYYLGSWEGNPLSSFASLLNGIHVSNVDIVGPGIINANAAQGDWWRNPKVKRGAWRPRMLFLNGCEQIRVQGITLENSYAWTVHPFYSKDVSLLDIRIYNDPDSPNTDGIDVEACSGVKICGAVISVGDDCVALKSSKIYMGSRLKTPTCGIALRNCLLERGHGAVVIGSDVSAGARSISATQCVFQGTDRGLRIKTRRGRGELSVVDRVSLENIWMDRVNTPFVVNMFYCCDPDGHSDYVSSKKPVPVNEFTPRVGNLSCRNIVCEHCSTAGVFLCGLPEMPIESVSFRNVRISFAADARAGYPAMMDGLEPVAKLGLFARNVKKLSLAGVTIEGFEGEKTDFADIEELWEEESNGHGDN